ncbi:MAG: hypothetical protein P4L35_02820 [Ignavibacteriaceae bacterium]|nr:hypothetical protein [Ignavibacteriaceae bacterium]
MLKSTSILVFIFIFPLFLLAQDQSSKKISNLESSRINPITSKSKGKNNYGIQSNHLTLPSDGSNTTSAAAPEGTYRYEREVYLITPAEMATVGIPSGINFTDIAWTYNNPGSTSVNGTLKIYFQNTTNVTNQKGTTWSTDISTMTLVDNNTNFTNPSSYYYDETLSNPSAFTYTGGGLYIGFDYSNPTNSLSTGTAVNTTAALTNGSIAGQSNTSTSPTLGNSSFRPETYLGYTIINEASVVQVYTLGKLPVPYGTPNKVSAVIQNGGDNDLSNLKVKLNITGANTLTDSITIVTLLSGNSQLITFTSWTPTIAGMDTIKVSVPPDFINTNNTITVIQQTTPNTYSYAYGPFPASVDGGVGLTGTTGDIAVKFHTSSSASISQVGVNFTFAGQPYKIGIWDATGTGGTPGTLLWQSTLKTSTAGISTLIVNPKVTVNGNFYVGVTQTGTTNLGFAYQTEGPIRDSTFYFTFPTGSSNWTNFTLTDNTFRVMIEPGLTLANDVGPSTIDYPQGGTYNNLTTNIAPKVTIANYGSNNQVSAFNATLKIYNASSSLVYTSTKSLTLNAGTTQQITFDATFNPTAQLYAAKCYTSLGSDANINNDTLTAALNYSQFSLSLTALLEAMFVSGKTAMTTTPSVTIELHNSITPYALIESKTATLSNAGFSNINNFTSLLNSISPYYIVVKSLTTLETWSASAVSFTSGVLSYDFTTGLGQAYTDGSNPPLAIHSGKYCIYSGDVSQDGQITSDDFTGVDNDNANFDFHIANDVNGDGQVTSDDFTWIDNNNTNFVARQIPPGAPGALTKRVMTK